MYKFKFENGDVIELICSYDPESRGGSTPDGRKVKGTIHWVSAARAIDASVKPIAGRKGMDPKITERSRHQAVSFDSRSVMPSPFESFPRQSW